jgi:hypothetical protein
VLEKHFCEGCVAWCAWCRTQMTGCLQRFCGSWWYWVWFSKLKLKGCWFDTVTDIQMSMMAQLNTSTEGEFFKCYESLYECCNKCIGLWETILSKMIDKHIGYIWFLLYFGIVTLLPHCKRGKWPQAGGNCLIMSFIMCMPCQILWSSETVSWAVRVVQMVAKRNLRDVTPDGKVTLWSSVLRC